MSRQTIRRRGLPALLAVAAASVAVGATTASSGATSSSSAATGRPVAHAATSPLRVVFKVKGPTNRRRNVRFCHKRKHIRLIKRGALTTYKGVVTPPFAKHFQVTVKVERCSRGRFVRVLKFKFQGKRLTGKFKTQRRAPRLIGRITFYSAVAVVNGHKSNKRYFAVVR